MAELDVPKAQWPVILDKKCELCDVNPIAFKCLNCDEMVCDQCKTAHLRSKLGKGHKVVCLKSAEIYESNENVKKCPSHTSEDLLMFCNTCNCPICRECVTSGVHIHHPMVKLEEVIDITEKQLLNIIQKANEKSKKYKDVITTINRNKQEFSMSIANKIDMVKSRNRELKMKLDNIESDYIKELENTDKANEKAMTELEQKIQEEMSDLNNMIQQCDQKQRDRNVEMIHFVTDVTRRLDKYRSCEPPDVACPPDLIARHIDDQEVKNLFGYLDAKKVPEVNPPLTPNRNVPSSSPDIGISPPLPPRRNITSASTALDINPPLPPRRNILSASPDLDVNPPLLPISNILSASPVVDVKTIGNFYSEKSDVVTTSNNQAWLWSFGDKGISLVTSDGKVIQDIYADFKVWDAAVSTSGDLFVTVYMGTKVKKLKRNNTFTDIYTADGCRTLGITVTDTGNFLVGLFKIMDSKIVEITTSGQHIRTIQHDTVDNKPLFNDPGSICTNINGDIIVVDGSKVVAVNKSGSKRFIYDGTEKKLSKSFNPWAVDTDKYGQIIISDGRNSVLHVLDRDGRFEQYLTKHEHGCDSPAGIAIDSSGILWVCDTGNKKISKIKYM